jgi:DNA invertase Pin-like site-specific DNA recombinase
VKKLVLALEEFRVLGIDFVSHEEAVDTTKPLGKIIINMIASMAELERGVVRERVVVGGKRIGRPRAIFSSSEAIDLRAQGWSWRKIAKTVGASATTVRRACKGQIDSR